MSGCTAFDTNGQDCLNHADREFVNAEGAKMRLCAKHDTRYYSLAVAAASVRGEESSDNPATAKYLDALRRWTE